MVLLYIYQVLSHSPDIRKFVQGLEVFYCPLLWASTESGSLTISVKNNNKIP